MAFTVASKAPPGVPQARTGDLIEAFNRKDDDPMSHVSQPAAAGQEGTGAPGMPASIVSVSRMRRTVCRFSRADLARIDAVRSRTTKAKSRAALIRALCLMALPIVEQAPTSLVVTP